MKECSKCKKFKEETDFRIRSSNKKLNSHCNECQKEYTRNHYLNNKKYYLDKAYRRGKEIRQWFEDYKNKLKCVSCGENDPVTFDFHHINPLKKDETIAFLVANNSWNLLQTELKKCVVLCANCHRKYHAMHLKLNLDEQLATNEKDG